MTFPAIPHRLVLLLLAVQAIVLARHLGPAHVLPAAVLLIEGGDHMSAAQFTRKGWNTAPGAVRAGRFGGQAFDCRTGSGVTWNATRSLKASATTVYAGFSILFFTDFNSNLSDIFVFRAAGVSAWRLQHSDGVLRVVNSSNVVVATGTTPLNQFGQWYYIEVKAVINGASGSCEVRLNGATEIPATTGNFGSTAIDGILLHRQGSLGAGVATGYGHSYDDMWVNDSGFLGDVRVATVYPQQDGAHSAWTPASGTDHFEMVNDPAAQDDDTTYLSDSTPDDIDTWIFGDVDGGAVIHGVQYTVTARKDDAAVRQVAAVARQSGTDHVGSTLTLGTSYASTVELYDTDPDGNAWTPDTFNNDVEFGVKEIA